MERDAELILMFFAGMIAMVMLLIMTTMCLLCVSSNPMTALNGNEGTRPGVPANDSGYGRQNVELSSISAIALWGPQGLRDAAGADGRGAGSGRAPTGQHPLRGTPRSVREDSRERPWYPRI